MLVLVLGTGVLGVEGVVGVVGMNLLWVFGRGRLVGTSIMAFMGEPSGIRAILRPTPIRSFITIKITSSSILYLLSAQRRATSHAFWWSMLTGFSRLVLTVATMLS